MAGHSRDRGAVSQECHREQTPPTAGALSLEALGWWWWNPKPPAQGRGPGEDSPKVLHDAGEHGGQLLQGGELVPAGRIGVQGQVQPGTQGWRKREGAPSTYP